MSLQSSEENVDINLPIFGAKYITLEVPATHDSENKRTSIGDGDEIDSETLRCTEVSFDPIGNGEASDVSLYGRAGPYFIPDDPEVEGAKSGQWVCGAFIYDNTQG